MTEQEMNAGVASVGMPERPSHSKTFLFHDAIILGVCTLLLYIGWRGR